MKKILLLLMTGFVIFSAGCAEEKGDDDVVLPVITEAIEQPKGEDNIEATEQPQEEDDIEKIEQPKEEDHVERKEAEGTEETASKENIYIEESQSAANTETTSDEEMIALFNERMTYYVKSTYCDEMMRYWEEVRGVTDVSYRMEPLYETDKRYLIKEELSYEPSTVIHLAKNEIYARHGYIFKDKDLYNYFMGCIWYTPTIEPEDFSDKVFNEYEIANLELLDELDSL